jgi:hypothetical protein
MHSPLNFLEEEVLHFQSIKLIVFNLKSYFKIFSVF